MLTTILSALKHLARQLSWSRGPSGWLAVLVTGGLLYCLVFDANQLNRWLVPGILILTWCLLWYSFVSLFPTAVLSDTTDASSKWGQRLTAKVRRAGYGVLALGMTATAIALVLMTSRLLNTWEYRSDLDLTQLHAPTTQHSALPNLSRAPNGRVILSWVEMPVEQVTPDVQKVAQLKFAELTDDGWSDATLVAQGSDWFLNWADFPSVIALDDQQVAAHWLRRSAEKTYAYDVEISQSLDNGATWQKPYPPHRDGTASEHGFVSLYATTSGLGAIWLDGRNTIADAPNNAMTLRSTQLARPVTSNISSDTSSLLDERVCDCCQTDVATVGDTVIAVYRDRDESEERDIAVQRMIDGQWLPSRLVARDGWRVTGCPVNGPAIASWSRATPNGTQARVAVAWYTEAAGPQIRLAMSSNAAASFDNAITIDDLQPIGRVDLAVDDDGSALVSWIRTTSESENSAQLVVRRIFPGGSMEPIRVVAQISAARSSGFPQMIRDRDTLVFAWTSTKTEKAVGGRIQARTTGILTASVPLSAI